MPEPLIIRTEIGEDGRIKNPRVRREIQEYLTMYAGGEVVFEIGPPGRTLSQNKFYWGFRIKPIVEALREVGMEASSKGIHAYFKEMFLHVEQEIVFGKRTVIEPTTTKLSTTEFDRYCESIRTSGEVQMLEEQLGRPLFESEYDYEVA